MTFIEDIEISEKWFETCSEEELNRFILGYNDGQGDHGFMTWIQMCELYIDVKVDDGTLPENLSFEEYLKLFPSRIDIIDFLYEEQEFLTGNNSDMLYFDGKYKSVSWVN
jgi:hypothetical protein